MRLRAPVLEDAPAILEVLVARDVADLGAPDYTLEDLLDEWRAGDLDLAADTRLAETDDGDVVGYVTVVERGTLTVVDPAHEDREIGARLLAWAEGRERERGRQRHRQWVAAGNEEGQALLRRAGYQPVRSYFRMVRELDAAGVAPVSAPAGFTFRPLEVDRDAAGLHALDDASFGATADYEPVSLAAFSEEHLLAHDLDPKLSCVAETGDRLAGFLLARRRPEGSGYVDILAVHPDHQGCGLGTALLRGAFTRFAASGLKHAELGVASDNPGALRLYERLGMRPRFRFDTYERPVAEPASDKQ